LQGEDRKQQILSAAIKVFSQYGYEKTSIAMVCEKAMIARGTIYQYFKNKHSLFREIVETYSKKIQVLGQPMDLSDPDCPPPEEFLFIRFYLMFEEVFNNKEVFSIILREALTMSANTEDIVSETNKAFTDLIGEEIDNGIRAGVYRPIDSQVTATFIYHGMRGIIERYLLDAEDSISRKELAEKAMKLCLAFFYYDASGHTTPPDLDKL